MRFDVICCGLEARVCGIYMDSSSQLNHVCCFVCPYGVYVQEDGISVEPRFFIPIIPALLLNGCRGIGTHITCDASWCNVGLGGIY